MLIPARLNLEDFPHGTVCIKLWGVPAGRKGTVGAPGAGDTYKGSGRSIDNAGINYGRSWCRP